MKNTIKKTLASMLSACGLLGFSRWLRIRCFNKSSVIILCYHRVVPEGGLISPQCISSELFEHQILFFASKFDFITLDDITPYLAGASEYKGDVMAITFDDGYADNYTHAAPILDRYAAKGTFFIASEPVLDKKSYWIDELSVLLDALHGTTADIDLPAEKALALQISQFIIAPKELKKRLAKDIFLSVNAVSEVQKHLLLKVLREACKVVASIPHKTPALMSAPQIKELINNGHTIGAHTHTHPRLSNLELNEVESEIVTGVTRLREEFGEINHFAYPFGKMADIPADKTALFNILQHCGFQLTVTTEDDVVKNNDHRFLVPRKVMSAQSVAQIRLKLELMAWKK
jgi:peptidoglycan/xylan/chitin deacetylase (PgdA/CDA1 family)